MQDMIEALASVRAVAVGESHDRFDHHLNQLEIIKRLHERGRGLAIGMEQFQQAFQPQLDAFVAGRIDTESMLLGTEYYDRWKFDYRLYEPILAYARRHRLPVIALNLPREVTRKVAAGGLSALSSEQRRDLPELDRSDRAYRKRLRSVFDQHPMSEHGGSFENFYTAQLLWDEAMAARAAGYLGDHPASAMVVLAGNGHVEFGSGIPNRLAGRIDGDVATVVNADDANGGEERADYVLHSSPVELPERGMLGVMVDDQADTEGALVNRLSDDSGAREAGVKPGDMITALDGEPVGGVADLLARMWDKRPGDRVSITVRRDADAPPVELRVVLR